MEKNFWQKLKEKKDGSGEPFFVLAPMADVTDAAFRRLIAKYGKPDVTWTEFVSADGLAYPTARPKLLTDLIYTEAERPIVAQLFTSNPENMREAAKLCAELGFDGIDINMGCPDKSIEKQGAGAAMIKTPEKAVAVIRAAKEGAPNLPISVKTRIGYSKNQISEWIPIILAEDVAALTVHLRTRKELSLVPAHWDLMKEVVALRDKLAPATLIIGNGDVKDVDEARAKAIETGCDGVMLGRAIFGNPWLFAKDKTSIASVQNTDLVDEAKEKFWLHREVGVPIEEKLRVLVEHTKLFEELLGDKKNFAIMKKHYKAYVNGFDGAKELRMKLMDAENAAEIEQLIKDFLLEHREF